MNIIMKGESSMNTMNTTKTTKKMNIFLIMILIIGMMIGVPVPAKAKIRKPSLALPVFNVKSKTKTTITFDFSYMAKHYLKGKRAIGGYQLYRKAKGKWKKLCTVKVKGKKKKSIKKTYKDKKLKTGKTYKYRVRTFKKVTGTKKVKKGKRKVKRKYKKTFYSKYKYLNVTTIPKVDGDGRPIDANYKYVDPFAKENKGYQQKMLNRINKYRGEKGLKPLKLNLQMCQMALIRAKEREQLFDYKRPNGSSWSTIFNDFNLDFTTSEGKAMSIQARAEISYFSADGCTWDMALGDCKDTPKGGNNNYVNQGWKQIAGHWDCLMDENADQFGIAHYFSAPSSAKPYLSKNLSNYPEVASYWVAIIGDSCEKRK